MYTIAVVARRPFILHSVLCHPADCPTLYCEENSGHKVRTFRVCKMIATQNPTTLVTKGLLSKQGLHSPVQFKIDITIGSSSLVPVCSHRGHPLCTRSLCATKLRLRAVLRAAHATMRLHFGLAEHVSLAAYRSSNVVRHFQQRKAPSFDPPVFAHVR